MSGSCSPENQVIFPRDDETQTCLLIGSILSFVSCGILIVAYAAFPSLRRQPNGLICAKSVMDICFVAFVWHTYFDANTDEDCRAGYSFLIAATLAGSEFCFVCLAYDLYLNLRSPFSSFKNGNIIYGCVVSIGAILCGTLITGYHGDGAGLWITGFCLTNYCRNKDVNLNWGFGTLTPISMGLVGAVLVIMYTRLTLTGWSDERIKIWKPRNRMIKLTQEYTIVYAAYWFITLICVYFPIWIFVSIEDNKMDKDPTDNLNSRRLMRVFLLFLSAKGVPTTIVWVKAWFKQWSENYFRVYGVRGMVGFRGIVNAASAFKFTDKSLAPDMNAALRTELVQYLTFGIEALSHTDENVVKLRPARFNRKSGWLQRMLHGDRQMYTSSNSTDSATAPLAENDQCIAPPMDTPPKLEHKEDDEVFEREDNEDGDFVKIPVIKSQDSSAFVLTESKKDEPFTASVENLFEAHFRRIRNALLPTSEYNNSLRTINPGKETQGRSGAFLFKTRDQRLILKTVTTTELEVLRSLLEDRVRSASSNSNDLTYTEYMETYGHESLIMKIVGCFRLTLHEYGNESKVFIVCMNVLPNNKQVTVDELYDLKGSIMSRNVSRPAEGSEAFCKYCHKSYIVCNREKLEKMRTHRRGSTSMLFGSTDVAMKEEEEEEEQEEDEVDDMYSQTCPSSSRYHEPIMLFKDNDLKRKIALPKDKVTYLKTCIRRDVKWFLAHGIMDYSMLLGVVWGSYQVKTEEPEKKESDNDNAEEEEGEASSPTILPSVIPMYTTRDHLKRQNTTTTTTFVSLPIISTNKKQNFTSRCYDAHVVEAPKSYYMGMIDILQRFDWSKKAEYYIKTGLLKKDWHTISCAEPAFYARRFMNFMDEIIVDDMQRSMLHQEKITVDSE